MHANGPEGTVDDWNGLTFSTLTEAGTHPHLPHRLSKLLSPHSRVVGKVSV